MDCDFAIQVTQTTLQQLFLIKTRPSEYNSLRQSFCTDWPFMKFSEYIFSGCEMNNQEQF